MTSTTNISVGIAFLGGILTVASPCILPILPILVGRSLQSHRLGPLVLVTGLIGGFAVAGSLLGITAAWFTSVANGLRTVAIAMLLIVGVLTLFPALHRCLVQAISRIGWRKEPSRVDPRIGLMGEFWLGTQLGLLWTPCAGPVLAGILLLAAAQQQAMLAFGMLIIFGLGTAIPLLAIAYGGRTVSRKLMNFRTYGTVLQRIAGGMIWGTAIAILLGWDVQIQLWLAPFFPQLPY
jgi:cytochrome c biogenesis protein CcdA